MHKHLAATTTLLLLTLTGCATTPTTEPSPTEPTRQQVDWTKYPTDYQRIVDEETTEQDCTALQEMFDAAPNDYDLLTYIDEALRIANCY
jgi:hypothetical protein